MRKKYESPEFDVKVILLTEDVLNVSNPEFTVPETGSPLPRDEDVW